MTDASPSARTGLDSLVARVADEFTARQKQGEEPNIEEYAARYPEHATVLREVLAALQLVRLSGISGSGGPAAEESLAGALGDFRLIREIGRGGMGVVYEAEQISLRRRVALKVLPFAATMDPKHLQRFHNEARAAACLHHEHIIPVYFVGSERGVHFYAMQFIDGCTVAQFIQALQPKEEQAGAYPDATGDDHPAGDTPTAPIAGLSTQRSGHSGRHYYRQAAQLIAQAADALEHAHSLGIVHRDIKPANLIVDRDGKLWVGDFGLARCGPDAGLTMSGDLLGTLRYMAPEQAFARHGLVDHRADVYGLGATLYELLTLRPAVEATERAEILRQIAFEEPKAARKIDPLIPPELETIALKCLAKQPNERFSSAGELAEDLRCWLADKPIAARPPTLRQRLAKWARRHKTAVNTSVVVALVAAAIGTAVTWREKEQTKTALRLAEQRTRWARRAVNDMYSEVAEKWLANTPLMTEVQRSFLSRALEFYEEIAKEQSSDPDVRLETARAYRRIGQLQLVLWKQGHLAEQAFSHAAGVAQKLLDEFPENDDYRLELCRILVGLSNWHRESDRLEEAERYARQALAASGKFRSPPGLTPAGTFVDGLPALDSDRHVVGHLYGVLGLALARSQRPGEAESAFRERLRIFEQIAAAPLGGRAAKDQELATAYALGDVAVLLATNGRRHEAEHLMRQLLRPFEGQPTQSRWPQATTEIVACFSNQLGGVLIDMGRFAEAEELIGRSRRLRDNKYLEFPDEIISKTGSARTYNNWGRLLARTGRSSEAKPAFERALVLQKGALAETPDHPSIRYDWAVMHNNLACLLATSPDLQVRDPAAALRLAEQAVRLIPQQGEPWNSVYTAVYTLYYRARDQQARVAALWNTLGIAQYRAGQWQAAIDSLNRSMQLYAGGDSFDWFFLAMAHWELGHKGEARSWYREAVQWMDKNKPDDDELTRFRTEAAELLGIPGGPKYRSEPKAAGSDGELQRTRNSEVVSPFWLESPRGTGQL